MIKITHHGGNCCGIKHIANLGVNPAYAVYNKTKTRKDELSTDRNGGVVSSAFNLYWPERPSETYGERFNAYLDYLAIIRPYGLVECTITTSNCGGFGISGDITGSMEWDLTPYEELRYDEDEEEIPEGGHYDQSPWIPVFEKCGFQKVSEFPNSNSGNYVQVWHLVMSGDWMKNRKEGKVDNEQDHSC